MGLKRIRVDSVAERRQKARETAEREALIVEQQETIGLLKECIMELADEVFSGEGEEG